MSTRSQFSRTITRLAALLVSVVTAGMVGLPAAHAADTSVHLMLLPGQSGSIGTVVSNTNVTPVPTCDPELSVTFDAAMEGTVTVAQNATLGLYTCAVDFQIDGQSTGLIEQILVTVGPGLSINDVAVAEGNPPFTPRVQSEIATVPNVATFTVSLSAASTNTVSVRVSTSNGTASSSSDYGSLVTTVTFAPGETSESVSVPIDADSTVEPDETFTVNLSKPTNALIADGQGIGTILNDDTDPIPA